MTADNTSLAPPPADRWLKPVRRALARVAARLRAELMSLSPKARFAVGLGLLAMVLLGISTYLSLPSATLRLVCRLDVPSADITVSVDGDVVHTETLTGAVKKWLGVLEKPGGTYTRMIPTSPGRHLVEVRLQAAGYDHVRSVDADFARGKETTLSVDAGRRLSLSARSPEAPTRGADPTSSAFPWLKYTFSIVTTIFASIASAAIGVLVQDFLRARKARLTEEAGARRSESL